ncbi:hypothetical protein FPV67DRAFT_1446849 [Lyophyllum atratum]|nr:hypothetical protein FPV67DRAFT_1446849 [Lyophyllum atratum]
MTRPRGSRDGPRPPGAPRRGRPPKIRDQQLSQQDHDADDEYGFDDDFPAEFDWEEVKRVEREALGARASPEPPGSSSRAPANAAINAFEPTPRIPEESRDTSAAADRVGFEQLREATKRSRTRPIIKGPFFTRRDTQDFDSGDETDADGMDSQNDEDLPSMRSAETGINIPDGSATATAWFKQPKTMPDWLYRFFGDTIAPLIFAKEGRHLVKPPLFSEKLQRHAPPTFWVHQPEPAIPLSHHRFLPSNLYQPRVFLWLPHFYVAQLRCPKCPSGVLEKNGALTPRRITDVDDSFYIVAWAYYCRKGCRAHFYGWSKCFLDSLPAYLRLAFPATLSRKGGLSRNVISQLRVGNQHNTGCKRQCFHKRYLEQIVKKYLIY